MEEAGEIPQRPDQWLVAEQHTFFCDCGSDTRGTSWTPCFIRNQVKYGSMQYERAGEKKKKEKQMLIRQEKPICPLKM